MTPNVPNITDGRGRHASVYFTTINYELKCVCTRLVTSSSAMAERRRELGDFKGVGHFEAKF